MFRCALAILLALFSLCACNYHLRGTMTLAPALHKVYLQAQSPYGDLARNLKQALRRSGVQVVNSPQEATAILNLTREDSTQDLLSINSSQQTRQYSLKLIVSFEVLTPQGSKSLPPQTVMETRTLTLQSNQILAGSNQAAQLNAEMRRAITYDIMARLSSQSASKTLSQADSNED